MMIYALLLTVGTIAAGSPVEAVGRAEVTQGNAPQAEELALQRAFRKAVEKSMGVTVSSTFTSQQREIVRGKKSQFNARVQEILDQKSQGFIERHEVLSKQRRGDAIEIRIRAWVYANKLEAEAAGLLRLIQKAGDPKLMLVIQERWRDAAGRRARPIGKTAEELEKALQSQGFRVVGNGVARRIVGRSAGKFDAWLSDLSAVQTSARKAKADLVVFGTLSVRNEGKITDSPFASLKGQTRLEIEADVRGINAESGEVLSTQPARMSSVGINAERAMNRAIVGRGKNLVKRVFEGLMADLQQSLEQTVSQGREYTVELLKVQSFRREATPFLQALQGLPGIERAAQQSFSGGALRISLRFKGTPTALQTLIFNALDENERFKDLDLSAVDGTRLSFSL